MENSVNVLNIKNAEFLILSDHGVYSLQQGTQKACLEGWYPLTDSPGKKGTEWIQVMIREKVESVSYPKKQKVR